MGNAISRVYNHNLEWILTRDKMCQSKFLIAAADGNIKIMHRMLEVNEYLAHSVDYDMRTAFHLACAEGHIDVIKLLLRSGVKSMVKDRWGHEPLQDAMLNGHAEVVDFLTSLGVSLSNESKYALEGRMCLLASQGDLKQIEMLVKCGVSINSADYDGRSTLHTSVACKHIDLVDYLLRNKADANSNDRWGRTPIVDAISIGHTQIQERLIAAGAVLPTDPVVDCQAAESGPSNSDQRAIKSAFLESAAAGDVEQMRRRLAQGAHADDSDYDRRTALHLACSEGHLAAAEALIALGARTDAQDRWGQVPLQDAMRHGHRAVADLLRRAGATLSPDAAAEMGLRACDLAYRGDLDGLSRLVECGVPPVVADRERRTPLHAAFIGKWTCFAAGNRRAPFPPPSPGLGTLGWLRGLWVT